MHFEDAEIDQPSPNNNKSKVLGVIVLTDNRQTPQNLKSKPSELRSSAFKGTFPPIQKPKSTLSTLNLILQAALEMKTSSPN